MGSTGGAGRFDWLFEEPTDPDLPTRNPHAGNETSHAPDVPEFCLVAATAAVVRLDERLTMAPPDVRSGWLERMLVREAAASARLEGWIVDADRLELLARGAAVGAPDAHEAQALRLLAFVRAAARRSPRQMFTARRLAALASVRDGVGMRRAAAWLGLVPDGSAGGMEALQSFFSGFTVGNVGGHVALRHSAAMLARWHASDAGTLFGGAFGRMIATALSARVGLTATPLPLLSLGFLGQAHSYRPWAPDWESRCLSGFERGAIRGLELAGALARRRADLIEALADRRRERHLPAAVSALVANGGVTASDLGTAAGITPRAAAMLIDLLVERGLIRDVTGRASFRVFALTGLP